MLNDCFSNANNKNKTTSRNGYMDISNKKYAEMVKEKSPPSPLLKNCVLAFIVGGSICCFGEALFKLYEMLGMNNKEVRALVPATLILIAAILTGIGIFDKIAKYAGAGTIVPITGFANSVVSPALEHKTEGYIMGTGTNLFRISGPVIAYGTLAATVFGAIYYVIKTVML